MGITHAEARSAIAAGHDRAAELGVAVAIVVVDAAGLPIALGRMDGAMALSTSIAEGKAVAAAVLARDGDAVLKLHDDRPAFYQAAAAMTRVTIVPGLGSLVARGEDGVRGAVGVSGAKPEEDLECARAALAALSPG